ncbi:Putative ankyrin repeat protein RF_0381, partial [Durusdinium trenchii]
AAYVGDVEAVEQLIKDRPGLLGARDARERTPFFCALANGQTEVVKFFIKKGVNTKELSPRGLAPIHVVATNPLGPVEIVKALVDSGVEIDTVDYKGRTALHHCAMSGNGDIAEYLVELKADASKGDNDGVAPLSMALRRGNSRVIHAILGLLGESVETLFSTATGKRAVDDMISQDDLVGLNSLIDLGMDVNHKSDNGETVFTTACREGRHRVVRRLLEIGVDLESTNPGAKYVAMEKDPVHLLIRSGSLDLACEVVNRGAYAFARDNNGSTTLHLAAAVSTATSDPSTHTALVKVLLDEGHDPNVADSKGNSPLHAVAMCNQTPENESDQAVVAVFELLCEYGADVDQLNDQEATPLMVLAQSCFQLYGPKLAKLLLDSSQDVNAKDCKQGRNALHLAVTCKNLKIARVLLDSKTELSDVNQEDDERMTPFGTCIRLTSDAEREDLLLLMLNHDADVTKPLGMAQLPPIWEAIQGGRGSFELVMLLLMHKCDANVRFNPVEKEPGSGEPKDETTPLLALLDTSDYYAADSAQGKPGTFEVVKALLEQGGADVNARDGLGRTALMKVCGYAAQNHASTIATDIIDLLLDKGADCDVMSDDNKTPFLLLARRREVSLELLLRLAPSTTELRNACVMRDDGGIEENVVSMLLNESTNLGVLSQLLQEMPDLRCDFLVGEKQESALMRLARKAWFGPVPVAKDPAAEAAPSSSTEDAPVARDASMTDREGVPGEDDDPPPVVAQRAEDGEASKGTKRARKWISGNQDSTSNGSQDNSSSKPDPSAPSTITLADALVRNGADPNYAVSISSRKQKARELKEKAELAAKEKDDETRESNKRSSRRRSSRRSSRRGSQDSRKTGDAKDEGGPEEEQGIDADGRKAASNEEMAEIDLDASAELRTALLLAVNAGNVHFVRWLIENGADPNICDSHGKSAIMWAISENPAEKELFDLLLHEVDLGHVNFKDGNTVLHLAVDNQTVGFLEPLLKAGADPNVFNKADQTPLLLLLRHLLASGSEKDPREPVKLMLDAGADPNAQDSNGLSVVEQVCVAGRADLLEDLVKAGADLSVSHGDAKESLLHKSAKFNGGHVITEVLLREGLDIDTPNKEGTTALHYHIARGHPLSVAWMLKKGASATLRDSFGRNALHVLALFPNMATLETFDQLVPHLDTLEGVTNRGNTALMMAVRERNNTLVVRLVQEGADLNAANSQGRTPLMASLAGDFGRLPAFFTLLRQGADPHAQDHKGNTALHKLLATLKDLGSKAAKEVNRKKALASRALLGFLDLAPRSVWNIPNAKGLTPLHYAMWCDWIHDTLLSTRILRRAAGGDGFDLAAHGSLLLKIGAKNHRTQTCLALFAMGAVLKPTSSEVECEGLDPAQAEEHAKEMWARLLKQASEVPKKPSFPDPPTSTSGLPKLDVNLDVHFTADAVQRAGADELAVLLCSSELISEYALPKLAPLPKNQNHPGAVSGSRGRAAAAAAVAAAAAAAAMTSPAPSPNAQGTEAAATPATFSLEHYGQPEAWQRVVWCQARMRGALVRRRDLQDIAQEMRRQKQLDEAAAEEAQHKHAIEAERHTARRMYANVLKAAKWVQIGRISVEGLRHFVSLVPETVWNTPMNDDGRTIVHELCRKNLLEGVEAVVQAGGDVLLADTRFGRNALHLAVLHGDVRLVELLLDVGGSLDSETRDGSTPLHLAFLRAAFARSDKERDRVQAIVQVLLDNGAHPEAHGPEQATLLHLAVQAGNMVLLESVKGALRGEVDVPMLNGMTPLMLAVSPFGGGRDPAIVEEILNLGATVDLTDGQAQRMIELQEHGFPEESTKTRDAGKHVAEEGRTALHFACTAVTAASGDLLKALLGEHGADLTVVDARGETAVMVLAQSPTDDEEARSIVVKAIANVEGGATPLVNAANVDGWTALHFCAMNGKSHLVQQLLELNGDPAAPDKVLGMTPLHVAAKFNSVGVAEALLDASPALLDEPNLHGESPLFLAIVSDRMAMTELLVERGASSKFSLGGVQGCPQIHPLTGALPLGTEVMALGKRHCNTCARELTVDNIARACEACNYHVCEDCAARDPESFITALEVARRAEARSCIAFLEFFFDSDLAGVLDELSLRSRAVDLFSSRLRTVSSLKDMTSDDLIVQLAIDDEVADRMVEKVRAHLRSSQGSRASRRLSQMGGAIRRASRRVSRSMLGLFAAANATLLFSAVPAAMGKGAPFMPTLRKSMDVIFGEVLPRLKPLARTSSSATQTPLLVDLGSGDGRVVIEAARNGYRARGYELNPGLVAFSWLWAGFDKHVAHRVLASHKPWPVTGSASFACKNLWDLDLGEGDIIMVYGLTPIMERLSGKLLVEAKKDAVVVSNVFSISEKHWTKVAQREEVFVYVRKTQTE